MREVRDLIVTAKDGMLKTRMVMGGVLEVMKETKKKKESEERGDDRTINLCDSDIDGMGELEEEERGGGEKEEVGVVGRERRLFAR